jgi:hypothetical protein
MIDALVLLVYASSWHPFVSALILVSLYFGWQSAITTFRSQMADERKVWFMVACTGVISLWIIVHNI